MSLNTRAGRLQASTGLMMSPAECQAAVSRYAAAFGDAAGTFPDAITPADLEAAIITTCSRFQQRLMACWLPGDD